MMAKQRFEITGEWSGPQNPAGNFTRLQHREVVTDPTLAAWCQKAGLIRYCDGTALYLRVRPLNKGERALPAIYGYGKLIRDCAAFDEHRVGHLPQTPDERRARLCAQAFRPFAEATP